MIDMTAHGTAGTPTACSIGQRPSTYRITVPGVLQKEGSHSIHRVVACLELEEQSAPYVGP